MTDERYTLTQRALLDLDDIWIYTKDRWSTEQADRYLKLLYSEFNFLSTNPKSGQVFREVEFRYRFTRVKSHTIFYRESGARIIIVRVLHSRMNTIERLSE